MRAAGGGEDTTQLLWEQKSNNQKLTELELLNEASLSVHRMNEQPSSSNWLLKSCEVETPERPSRTGRSW